jgi:hypothetical protein
MLKKKITSLWSIMAFVAVIGLSDFAFDAGEALGQCTLHPNFVETTLSEGMTHFTDRSYTLTSVPSQYIGMDMIKTPNDERSRTCGSGYITFTMPSDGTVYIAYDRRATSLPNWASGFSDTLDDIDTSLSKQGWLDVYSRDYTAGSCVDLGCNKGPGYGGSGSNYLVFYDAGGGGTGCTPDAYEFDDSSAQATPLTSGSQQTHNICSDGEEDWFTFTLASDSGVDIVVTSQPGHYVYLYDSNLISIESSQPSIDRVCGTDELAAGTYYVMVTNLNFQTVPLEYTISLTVTPCSASGGAGNCTDCPDAWSKVIPDANDRFELVMNGEAVLDRETCLVWEQSPTTERFAWNTALEHCFRTGVGGHGGWRLPTIEELASLNMCRSEGDCSQSNPTLPSGYDNFFSNVQSSFYWSSTTYARIPSDAWGVNFMNGFMSGDGKTERDHVWCVRGGQGHDAY